MRAVGAAAATSSMEVVPKVDHQLAAGLQGGGGGGRGDLAHLDLRGPHDLRHTFATWLEDAAIPSRVIDELMGHASGRRDRGAGGSPMGRVYRETTPAMVARVTAALDDRIGRALAVAAYLLRERRDSGRSAAERAVDLGWS